MDVKIAFLNEELEDKVYVDQPKDFLFERKDHIKAFWLWYIKCNDTIKAFWF